jgi:hypothetical protein
MINGLTPAYLLQVWEAGYGQSHATRGYLLLSMACPQLTRVTLLQLSIGQRDAALLGLRAATFGSHMTSFAACPECSAQLEIQLNTHDLLLIEVDDSPDPIPPIDLMLDDVHVICRVPNVGDSLQLETTQTIDATANLLSACVLQLEQEGQSLVVDSLDDEAQNVITEAMEKHDPQANIELILQCQNCGHEWTSLFDIVTFLWRELDNEAQHIIRDVHTLAHTYGWSEHDILALSTWRRQIYITMTGVS